MTPFLPQNKKITQKINNMDRKGWIMLILCGVGMMLTWNWMKESAAQDKALIEQQQTDAKKNSSEDGKANGSEEAKVQGFENVPDPAEVIKEENYELVSKNEKGEIVNKYVFTNKGGGIKEAWMISESELNGQPVKVNQYGKFPIGSIARDDNDIQPFIYTKTAQTDSSITFLYSSEAGYQIEKTWELAKDVEKQEYRIKLAVQFYNKYSVEPIRLKSYSLTSGVTAPLIQDERQDLCKWYYYQNNDFEDKSSGPFTTGWFGWGTAKQVEIIDTQKLEYFGVSSQFYTTLIQPSEPNEFERIWVSSDLVKMHDAEPDDEKRRIYTIATNFPDKDVAKDTKSSRYEFDFYIGPRKQANLKAIGDNTGDALAYGWFGFGAPIMNSAINWIHDVIAEKIYEPWSWGLAIVVLTIIIRIVIWPLHNKATRTMKRMSKLQPMMKEIREKYADNPQKVQQETLGLYKKYKVNPMGGCLPILVQMPIFFAVFGMLTNAVELRGQSFLWVKDLSAQENVWTIPFLDVPLNILPILMAGTMILQMKMTPSTGDKMQRRLFMLMPIIFFFFCYSYASALALYWTVQNIISIGQTWLTQRLPEPELVEASQDDNTPRKKGFMEKLAEKMEEAQQQREQMMAQKSGKPAPKQAKTSSDNKEKKRSPKTGG